MLKVNRHSRLCSLNKSPCDITATAGLREASAGTLAAHRLIYWLASLTKSRGIMAIEAAHDCSAKSGERLAGLNHVAELRARY